MNTKVNEFINANVEAGKGHKLCRWVQEDCPIYGSSWYPTVHRKKSIPYYQGLVKYLNKAREIGWDRGARGKLALDCVVVEQIEPVAFFFESNFLFFCSFNCL